MHVERMLICTLKVGQLLIQPRRFQPLTQDTPCLLPQMWLQESEAEKRDRLLLELSDDTKVQKKKPWYGLF